MTEKREPNNAQLKHYFLDIFCLLLGIASATLVDFGRALVGTDQDRSIWQMPRLFTLRGVPRPADGFGVVILIWVVLCQLTGT